MLTDLTASGVRAAVEEFDRLGRRAFLDRYGFGEARTYFLVIEGRRYDSKAICGAAHGFDFPDRGPLRPDDFSGGDATVRKTLDHLGFAVEKVGPGWTEEERILALDLYLRDGMAPKNSDAVESLSVELNERAFHPDAGTRANFRNPAGVALKLANFASLDPEHAGKGMDRVSTGDRATWNDYAGDRDRLQAAVDLVRAGHLVTPQRQPNRDAIRPMSQDVEQQWRATFDAGPGAGGERTRREARLVLDFAAHVEGMGHRIGAHAYDLGDITLRNDLADETTRTLWEAKSNADRTSFRMAIGQLLDYRRFEPADWRIGILLPRRPHEDLIALAETIPASLAWRTNDEPFYILDNEPPRTAGPSG